MNIVCHRLPTRYKTRVTNSNLFPLTMPLDTPGENNPIIVSIEIEAWLPDANDDADEDDGKRLEHALRFSLAGLQFKFSAIRGPWRIDHSG